MRAQFLLSLLPFALAKRHDNPPPTTQIHDPRLPIHLGEVFWPPTMTFLAFLPPPSDSKHTPQTYWCWSALDVTNHILFNLGGHTNLQVQDYFSEQAYLEREGKRWANCYITPESERMGACQGVEDWDCQGGQRFTGPGVRKWSCWAVDLEGAMREYEQRLMERDALKSNGTIAAVGSDGLTSEGVVKATETASVTGAMESSEIIGGFRPSMTM
ncbi:hypothetical protein BJ875DRAFT_50281 [Amylocarpus encephaloides]|uniref:Uncharacterized protein n=1 Tax=Amylocarpus encephaloides TaxID=45428 RepID=A0A9P7YGS4_9HELO|nr:hypothetical protein BJ875DRAFT_50281 [Amylocarpus encephaloides]